MGGGLGSESMERSPGSRDPLHEVGVLSIVVACLGSKRCCRSSTVPGRRRFALRLGAITAACCRRNEPNVCESRALRPPYERRAGEYSFGLRTPSSCACASNRSESGRSTRLALRDQANGGGTHLQAPPKRCGSRGAEWRRWRCLR